ncbi:MAG TPA: prepilin-type N-terminal cleavage/methylation domain-containing protein [Phycisphaerales bacterium]|nr:prepilin-type N-terminal cleavage/methylation domain-containing protein [Phycisphaerales bacterium]
MKRNGFTLIELLVVIAIIALLLSILMPSLQTIKKIAQGVVCSNNTKTLSTGAVLFAQDNNDAVPNSNLSKIEDWYDEEKDKNKNR